jgi:hypothetical protein
MPNTSPSLNGYTRDTITDGVQRALPKSQRAFVSIPIA